MKRKMQNNLQNIKTLSDRVSDAEKPQRKFIKLAILELEKVRRSKEKNKAREQLINLDKRLAEIEAEQARLIEAVMSCILAPARPLSARRTPKSSSPIIIKTTHHKISKTMLISK